MDLSEFITLRVGLPDAAVLSVRQSYCAERKDHYDLGTADDVLSLSEVRVEI